MREWLPWFSVAVGATALILVVMVRIFALKNLARFRYYKPAMIVTSIIGYIGCGLAVGSLYINPEPFLVVRIVSMMISAFIGLLAWPYKIGGE